MSDPETVHAFLRLLGHRVALVGMKPREPRIPKTHVIWPADQHEPEDHACWLSSRYASVYCNLNPLVPEILECVPSAGVSVRDKMIARRTRLLIDIDAHGGEPESVEPQKDAIRDRYGLPRIETFSGRGYGLIYPIDYPNDTTASHRIKTFLLNLNGEFPAVDVSVFGAGRLTRVIGTANRSIPSRILS